MSYVLGIDTSTTATKVVVVDPAGTVVGLGVHRYRYETPRPLWSEQDPSLWAEATLGAIGDALADGRVAGPDVKGIGLTGQMHGLVMLDQSGAPLRPAILWNDQRTEAECDEMRQAIGFERMVEITGNDALPGFTASKILWVRNHEPDVFSRLATVLLPKDFVRYTLTDGLAVDRAGGSGTQLFDLSRRTWSAEILETLDLDPAWFPETFEGPDVTGRLTVDAAAATGLEPGIPVVAGGGDQAAAAVGVGAVKPAILSLSLGTSGVVFAPLGEMVIDPQGRLHAFCHAVPDRWHLMGVMLSAAGSVRWFRDTFMPGRTFDAVTAAARSASPGSDGLLFLPYLSGERTPHADPRARGAFVGLTVRHGLEEMARAVLEGVAFGLRDSFELIIRAAPGVDEVRISGGGAVSPLWRQIIADVLGAPLAIAHTSEGAAYGAAILAAVGIGWADSVDEVVDDWITVEQAETPGEQWDASGSYDRYRQLYPALASTFRAM